MYRWGFELAIVRSTAKVVWAIPLDYLYYLMERITIRTYMAILKLSQKNSRNGENHVLPFGSSVYVFPHYQAHFVHYDQYLHWLDECDSDE